MLRKRYRGGHIGQPLHEGFFYTMTDVGNDMIVGPNQLTANVKNAFYPL